MGAGEYSVGLPANSLTNVNDPESLSTDSPLLKASLQIPSPLLIGLIILTIARLVIAGSNELTEDEAYYHMWSERPARGGVRKIGEDPKILLEDLRDLKIIPPSCLACGKISLWRALPCPNSKT